MSSIDAIVQGGSRRCICLHFDRGNIERPSWIGREYERRQGNCAKKDHYNSRYCSGDVVNSGIDVVHCGGTGGNGKRPPDTSLKSRRTRSHPEFTRAGRPLRSQHSALLFSQCQCLPAGLLFDSTRLSTQPWTPNISYTEFYGVLHHGQFTLSSPRYASSVERRCL
jgi:hypothetical protein